MALFALAWKFLSCRCEAWRVSQSYLQHFDTVEINSSLYRLPTEKALIDWRNSVPKHFIFAVKASRYITHNKKLKDSGDSFQLFFNQVKFLEGRLGPILFQLPPKWKYNGDRLEEFIAALPKPHSYVFEFRNRDWLRDDMFDLLKKYQVGFCIHDMPDSITPKIVTANLAYIRFHGNGEKYSGGYSDDILDQWAKTLINWHRSHIESFVYFNNDLGGFAPQNAMTLKNLINQKMQD